MRGKKGLLLKAIYTLNNNITWIIARLKIPRELTPYKLMLPETTVEPKEINVMPHTSNAIIGLLSEIPTHFNYQTRSNLLSELFFIKTKFSPTHSNVSWILFYNYLSQSCKNNTILIIKKIFSCLYTIHFIKMISLYKYNIVEILLPSHLIDFSINSAADSKTCTEVITFEEKYLNTNVNLYTS